MGADAAYADFLARLVRQVRDPAIRVADAATKDDRRVAQNPEELVADICSIATEQFFDAAFSGKLAITYRSETGDEWSLARAAGGNAEASAEFRTKVSRFATSTVASLYRELRYGKADRDARRLTVAASVGNSELLHELVPILVDSIIGYVLIAVDQEILPLTFVGDDGSSLYLPTASDGLSGDYGSGPWVPRFTSERFRADDYDTV